jgi:DNA repair protein RadB
MGMKDPLSLFDLEPGVITTVFGPPGVGKTTFCLLAAKALSKKRKALIIDTEFGVSGARLSQIGSFDFSLLRPESFAELHDKILFLRRLPPEVSVVVLDSASMLYRLALGKDPSKANDCLARQLGALSLIGRRQKIPILLTAHCYVPFGGKDVALAGGDILEYRSKVILELRRDGLDRVAEIRKHRSLPEGVRQGFRIVQGGFELKPRP